VAAPQPAADWRNAALYAPLRGCGRHAFAWEWLRRSSSYRAAIEAGDDDNIGNQLAARFGLHRFEEADRIAPSARPIWRADADPYVLTVEANCGHGDDLLDVVSFGPLATCHAGSERREHWLLSDGWRQIRLDVVRGTLRSGPARLEYHIAGLANAAPQVAALTRLIALARTGRFIPALFPVERRAHRWALVLRTHDALMAGTSQREIAERMFDLGTLPRWRIEAPSWRRRVQRLVEAARAAAGTDPRLWLSGAFP
jgi:hypothetical protein